jgi:hypothetical protein
MGGRIDDLESSIGELMAQAGVEDGGEDGGAAVTDEGQKS